MAKKETKKPTKVALAPIVRGGLMLGGAFGAGRGVDELRRKIFGDDDKVKKDSPSKTKEIQLQKIDDAEVEKLQKMIDEETKKKRKGKQVKGTLTAKKGGLIKSKKKAVKKFRGDGIAKRGKTKGRII